MKSFERNMNMEWKRCTSPNRCQTGAALATLISVALSGCGSWAGSPKSGTGPAAGTGGDTGGDGLSRSVVLAPGETVLQKVRLRAGQAVSSRYRLAQNETGLALSADEISRQEVSVLAPDDRELAFSRPLGADLDVPVAAASDGEYTITLRNNGTDSLRVEMDESSTAESESGALTGLRKANGAEAPFRDYTLRAALFFSQDCSRDNSQYMTAARNSREQLSSYNKVVRAPEGEYFAQPIVFLGKVGSDGSVQPLAGAVIKLKVGDREAALQSLEDLPLDAIGASASGGNINAPEQARAAVRTEYAGFIGGAGELYTLPTFRKLGDCDSAVSFPLSDDPGRDTVQLVVEAPEASPALSRVIPVKVTVGSSFKTYSSGSNVQANWDLCSYNPSTGEPYNSSASSADAPQPCSSFSLSQPPSVSVDQLASEIYPDKVTVESDPTRVIFYGRSLSRSFIEAIVGNAAGNEADENPSVRFDGCLYNGGVVSLPAAKQQTFLPVNEFNLKEGDIFSLGSRMGSYTALTDFYQGNVQAGGNLTLWRNLPTAGGTLTWKGLGVSWSGCTVRADSGVCAAAIGDYGVYPGDEGMYGVVLP